jgi:hypothetical protein
MIAADYNIVVIASDRAGASALPRFARDDIAGIADFIATYIAR